MLQTKEECLAEMEEVLKSLHEIVVQFDELKPKNTQTHLFHYFASRVAEIGTAASRIPDLGVPLAILCRVLCEDFISLYWVAQSGQNAEHYTKRSLREVGRRAVILLSRAIEDKKRKGESVEGISLEPFQKMTPKIKPLAVMDMAKELGLEPLYDHVYRGTSLDVHGNQSGTFLIDWLHENLRVLSYVSTLLVLTTGLFTQGPKVVTPKIILEEFGLA